MKTVCKKLLCLMLVAMMLVSAVPFAFAAEEAIKVPVSVTMNGEVINSNKFLTVDAEGVVLDEALAMSMIEKPQGRAFASWTNSNGKTVTGNALSYDWVKKQEGYSLTINLVSATNDDNNEDQAPDSVPSTPLEPAIPNGGNNRPGQDNDNNNRPGQDNNNRPGQDNNNNNRPGQDNNNNNRPGQDNNNNNRPGQDNNNRPGQDNNNRPGNNSNHNQFPGNGHGKPNFKFETVELTVVYNFPDNHRYMGRTSETFTVWKGSDILDALAAAEAMGFYDVPTRDGYTMAGYSFDKECKNDVNRDDEINKDLTIYCEWEKSYVTLRVYTNGDTKYPDRTFDLSTYALDGKITQTEVENLLDSKYSAKSGYSLVYYGLFTDKTWDNGDYDTDDAVSSVKVNAFGKTTIYVMVKNVKKAVADSSNPKTGDNIMIAATTMALSAAALVSIVELKKRKMI